MQINNLKRAHPNKRSVQVGRGGKRGKTSGRGGKGQTARAGHKVRPEMRDIIKRIPKLRGRGKNIFQSFEIRAIPVNLELIEKHFLNGDTVSPETLIEKGLISRSKSHRPRVKILATGEITKGLKFSGCTFSATARGKIKKAGGTVISL
jgi:large subunit ribosomal protein L15